MNLESNDFTRKKVYHRQAYEARSTKYVNELNWRRLMHISGLHSDLDLWPPDPNRYDPHISLQDIQNEGDT